MPIPTHVAVLHYLGLKVEKNIGFVREEIINNLAQIPPGMTRRWINLLVQDCIVESKAYRSN